MFIFQLRLLTPLFLVGTRCRHPTLRREAAELLRIYDCQEGPWRTDATVRFIHTTAGIEEQGLSEVRDRSDVPQQNRASLVTGKLLEEIIPPPEALRHEIRSYVGCSSSV
jgi:hypothetical protein